MKPTLEQFALTFSTSAFYRLVAQGVVVDGRAGGLIVGRSILDGGVGVIEQRGDTFYLRYERAEDGDFVLNPSVRMHRLSAPRSLWHPRARVFTHLLITTAMPHDKFLWVTNGQIIVPQEQASLHLPELTDINTSRNGFLRCDVDEVLGAADGCDGEL